MRFPASSALSLCLVLAAPHRPSAQASPAPGQPPRITWGTGPETFPEREPGLSTFLLREYLPGASAGFLMGLAGMFVSMAVSQEICAGGESALGCGVENLIYGAWIGYGLGVPLGVHGSAKRHGYPGNLAAGYAGSLLTFWFPPITPLGVSAAYHLGHRPAAARAARPNAPALLDPPRLALTWSPQNPSPGLRADLLVFRLP